MPIPLLRPFRPEDAKRVLNRDGEHGLARSVVAQARSGLAFTAEVDGVPIGCGGIVMPWPGLAMCWMLLGDEICHYPKWVMRVVTRMLDDLDRAYGPLRCEAIALESSPRNQRWLEHLGFTVEQRGRAASYLPGALSVIRYERVKGA